MAAPTRLLYSTGKATGNPPILLGMLGVGLPTGLPIPTIHQTKGCAMPWFHCKWITCVEKALRKMPCTKAISLIMDMLVALKPSELLYILLMVWTPKPTCRGICLADL